MLPFLLGIVARILLDAFKTRLKSFFATFLSREQRFFLKEKKRFIQDTAEFVAKNKAIIQKGDPVQIARRLEQHMLDGSPSAQRIKKHYEEAQTSFNKFLDTVNIQKLVQKKVINKLKTETNQATKKALQKIIADTKQRVITAEELGGYLISTWVASNSYFIIDTTPQSIILGDNRWGVFVLKTQKSSKEYHIPMQAQYMLAMSTLWHSPDGGGAGSFLWHKQVTPHFTMLRDRISGAQRKAQRDKEKALQAKQLAKMRVAKAAKRAQASFNKTRGAR